MWFKNLLSNLKIAGVNRKNLGLESWLLNESISLPCVNLGKILDPLHFNH